MDVENSAEEFVEPVEPNKLCPSEMEGYTNNMKYDSQKERCANHDVSYNIEYESHEQRCAHDVEYESKHKSK